MKESQNFSQPFPDFRIIGKIGTGAMGAVFLARQLSLDRLVALKVLKPTLSKNASYVERLQREARLAARLDHQHIVTAYDLRHEKGYHFFVMEYVEGRSLRDLLKDWGRLPEDQVVEIGIVIAGALEHARQHGIIHRDIKPANILVQADNTVKLADLGLARGPETVSATRHGSGTMGTPLYMSPEQSRDPRSVDIRSDIFSLGATMFHLACGVPPFPGKTLGEVLTRMLHGGPAQPTESFPEISRGFDLVLRKCLVRNPDGRFQSPDELKADLQRVAAEKLPRLDPGELEKKVTSRHGFLVVLIILLLISGGLFLYLRKPGGSASGNNEKGNPVAKWQKKLNATHSVDLVEFIRDLTAARAKVGVAIDPVLALARKRLRGLVLAMVEAREKGLSQQLDDLHGQQLPEFPSRVDQELERNLTIAFGLAPEDLPDPRAVNVYTQSRKRLLDRWQLLVVKHYQKALARLDTLPAACQKTWEEQGFGHHYTRRLSLLKSKYTLSWISPTPLPAAETEQLRKAVNRERALMVARLRAEAESWVGTYRNRVKRILDQSRLDLQGELARADLHYLHEQLTELRQFIDKNSPPSDTIPRSWKIAWVPRAYKVQISRLESTIESKLLALEKRKLALLGDRIDVSLAARDYVTGRKLVLEAELVTAFAKASLRKTLQRVELQENGEKVVRSAVLAARNRVVDLSVKGVSQRRRIHRLTGKALPPEFIFIENNNRPGWVEKLNYLDLDIGSLVDLVGPSEQRQNALALIHLLLLGGSKEFTLAEALAENLTGQDKQKVVKMLATRRQETPGGLRQPEQEALALLKELRQTTGEKSKPEKNRQLADQLLEKYANTQLVRKQRDEIIRLRQQALGRAVQLLKIKNATRLFPGWDFISRWPEIEVDARLDRVLAGRVSGHRRWAYDERGAACYSPANSIADFLDDHWSLSTRLQQHPEIKAVVEVDLEDNFQPPGRLLLSLGSIHAGLVMCPPNRLNPPVWRVLLKTERRLHSNTFATSSWLAFLDDEAEDITLRSGCRYRLGLELAKAGRGGRRQVRFFLDGKVVATRYLAPPGLNDSPRLSLRLSGPARIVAVKLVGVAVE